MIRKGIALIVLLLFVGIIFTPLTIGNRELEKSVKTTPESYADPIWPMFCHDAHHTGRSQFSTEDNPFEEKWWFITPHELVYGYGVECFINIGGDGTIYLTDFYGYIYAIFPNGTLKWKFGEFKWIDPFECHPAIGEDGTIYAATKAGNFYAIYPNGTLKWRLNFSGIIYSSPTIAEDGTIYFGTTKEGNLYAVYPNGTVKWEYKLDDDFYLSSPAIADDGTIIIGNGDQLYSIYPNATLRWKVVLHDRNWIPNPPSIAVDGTIYVVTDSNDLPDYLYAVNPDDGSIKWKYKCGGSYFDMNPCIGNDGTIYIFSGRVLHAINPDGKKKWTRRLCSRDCEIWNEWNPTISADGTIYVVTTEIWNDLTGRGLENYLYAYNPDGEQLWHIFFDTPYYEVESSPVIGDNGTVFLGLVHCEKVSPHHYEYTTVLHAYNGRDPNAPSTPEIKGPNKGVPDESYNYTIVSNDPNGDDIYYYINWGLPSYYAPMDDFYPSELIEIGPCSSGEEIIINHTWEWRGKYTIRVRAKDTNNLVSPWGTLEVRIPKNKVIQNKWIPQRLEQFPILQKLIDILRLNSR